MGDDVFPTLRDSDGMECKGIGGLTKREYFAGLAMQGIRAAWPLEFDPSNRTSTDKCPWRSERVARMALADADALLAALAKPVEETNE